MAARYNRKEYEAVAEFAAPMRGPLKWDLVSYFACLFADDNPRFNRDRFFKASGYDPHASKTIDPDDLVVAADLLRLKGFGSAAEVLESYLSYLEG